MNTHFLTRARRNYSNPLIPVELNRRNRREWVRALRIVRATARGWLLEQRA